MRRSTMVRRSSGLSAVDQEDLERCETVIARGLQTFREVGEALAKIRDRRLYRASHKTFQEYCDHRWNFTRQRAHQLIEAASVVAEMSTRVDKESTSSSTCLPTTEKQARVLSRVEPERRAEVMAAAVEAAGGEEPTAGQVRQAAGAADSSDRSDQSDVPDHIARFMEGLAPVEARDERDGSDLADQSDGSDEAGRADEREGPIAELAERMVYALKTIEVGKARIEALTAERDALRAERDALAAAAAEQATAPDARDYRGDLKRMIGYLADAKAEIGKLQKQLGDVTAERDALRAELSGANNGEMAPEPERPEGPRPDSLAPGMVLRGTRRELLYDVVRRWPKGWEIKARWHDDPGFLLYDTDLKHFTVVEEAA